MGTIVRIGSRSEDKLDHWDSKMAISSRVAEINEVRKGEGDDGQWWIGVREGLFCMGQ